MTRSEFTGMGMAAAALAALLPIAYWSKFQYPTFEAKYAVMLLFAAGVVPLVRLARRSRITWSCRAALAFLVVGLISVALSPAWNIGLFGLYSWGTGWLLWLCCAGAFAIGGRLTRADLPLVAAGLIFGAVVNAVAAILDFVANSGALSLYQGDQAPGLMGNPIYLESIELGAIALLAPRVLWSKEFKAGQLWWWGLLALVSFGLELSLERVALFALLFLFIGAVAVWRARSLSFIAIVVGAYGAAYGIFGSGLGGRVTSNGSQETYGSRGHIWRLALQSVAHHPFFGIGPGQTESVMAPAMTRAFQAHIGATTLPTDSHDFLIEVLTTTGILGAICLVTWVCSAANKARGPLLAAAAAMLFVELVEPLNIGVTPLVFLFLGAATVPVGGAVGVRAFTAWVETVGRRAPEGGGQPATSVPAEPEVAAGSVSELSRRWRHVSGVMSAAILASSLVIGVAMVGSAYFTVQSQRPLLGATDVSSALQAQRLAPYFATSAIAVAGAYGDENGQTAPLEALKWVEKAAALDPADPLIRTDVGRAQLDLHNYPAALAEYRQALRLDPWTQEAFIGLASISAHYKNYAAAITWDLKAKSLGGLAIVAPIIDEQVAIWRKDLQRAH